MCDWVIMEKTDPTEIISVGDLIMLDITTSKVTRAVVSTDINIDNSKLIVGVCIESDNETPLETIIDGGGAVVEEPVILDGGDSEEIAEEEIDGEGSEINPRTVIKVAYAGNVFVNVCTPIDCGDKITISSTEGVAKSKDYIDDSYFETSVIGQVVEKTSNNNIVKALIDIR